MYVASSRGQLCCWSARQFFVTHTTWKRKLKIEVTRDRQRLMNKRRQHLCVVLIVMRGKWRRQWVGLHSCGLMCEGKTERQLRVHLIIHPRKAADVMLLGVFVCGCICWGQWVLWIMWFPTKLSKMGRIFIDNQNKTKTKHSSVLFICLHLNKKAWTNGCNENKYHGN